MKERITLDQFFEKLRLALGDYELVGRDFETIRLRLKTNPGTYFCPITLLCHSEGLGEYSISLAHDAGARLGLGFDDCRAIIGAADTTYYCDHKLRERLINTVLFPP